MPPAVHLTGAGYLRNFGTHRARGDGIVKMDLWHYYARAIPVAKLSAYTRLASCEGTNSDGISGGIARARSGTSLSRSESFSEQYARARGDGKPASRNPSFIRFFPRVRARCRRKSHHVRVCVAHPAFPFETERRLPIAGGRARGRSELHYDEPEPPPVRA